MSVVYLNGDYMPIEEARISPLDRGFLFGDGIYEFIPTYSGRAIGFEYHIDRMLTGLKNISVNIAELDWHTIVESLLNKNEAGNVGVYIQVSRGADTKRTHNFPKDVAPTVFIMIQKIAALVEPNIKTAKGFSLVSSLDRRWDNCHIKSTSLLGNVMHFQHGYENKVDETLLYNEKEELTECSACNVFIIKDDQICTPILDNQILPGVTRRILIEAINSDPSLKFTERVVTLQEAKNADELWITSSTKQIAPVTQLNGLPIGTGQVGAVWQKCQELYDGIKFS